MCHDNTYFDSIIQGLTESLEYTQGKQPNMKTHKETISYDPHIETSLSQNHKRVVEREI